ncbi:MAG: Cation/acetate symporter ActP [Paracidovorax wautersii]|uniref:Cation/acetate symporter ActP n=1 Tax=Paracidovorax wautersii TaxID=1177982 RepID=A0A7V8FNG8_9BURK|nr:MAG: Cation/acetate symporter ActP [Paracidovorax wautersii]
MTPTDDGQRAYLWRLHRWLLLLLASFAAFVGVLAWGETQGLPRNWIGIIFLLVTIGLYAGIGVYNRTSDPEEYYVAGRRIPSFYNGMAAASDWVSAASFISLAGSIYLFGYGGTAGAPSGLAYIIGWSGGFVLVAILVAPYLRRMKLYTLPDFFGVRYGGQWPRRVAVLAVVACSFTYVVAQIYGVGLVTSRLTGVRFEIGILLGLGGVLVCSFLGGMRTITWTQVAQYAVMLLAFLIPISWLAYKQLGTPMAPMAYGQLIAQIDRHERELQDDPAEQAVLAEYRRRAQDDERKLADVPQALAQERRQAQARLQHLSESGASADALFEASRALAEVPPDEASARARWTASLRENSARAAPAQDGVRWAQAYAGDPDGDAQAQALFSQSRLNYMALVFCLMLGTMGMPHLIVRYYTTPTVAQARTSVTWTLVFIGLIYLSAPALAVMVRYEVLEQLVGQPYAELPGWLTQWMRIDPGLLSVADVNGDGRVQFGEIRLGSDVLMLLMPELGGMPYVISGLVAAGGLAAALSTADGLLLSIGNALAHDTYFREVRNSRASAMSRVMLSKFALLLVALLAAYVAAQRAADILYLVSASFSLAAATFVPAMVLGIFWRGATRAGAVAGMLTGMAVVGYMLMGSGALAAIGLPWSGLWWGIQPISAVVWGVPAGLLVTWLVSLATRRGGQPAAAAL